MLYQTIKQANTGIGKAARIEMKIFLCKSEHKDGKKNNEHDTSVMACC
jgi:hypothetical protein